MLSSADLINTPTKQLGNRGEEKNRGEEQGTEEKSRGEEQGTEERSRRGPWALGLQLREDETGGEELPGGAERDRRDHELGAEERGLRDHELGGEERDRQYHELGGEERSLRDHLPSEEECSRREQLPGGVAGR